MARTGLHHRESFRKFRLAEELRGMRMPHCILEEGVEEFVHPCALRGRRSWCWVVQVSHEGC